MSITETEIHLPSPVVRALEISPDQPSSRYPFPEFSVGPESDVQTVPVLRFETDWLQATFAPTLGGRLLALHDKRTDEAIIALPNELSIQLQGSGELAWSHGVRFFAGRIPASLSLAAVDVFPIEDEDFLGLQVFWVGGDSSIIAEVEYRMPLHQAAIEISSTIRSSSPHPGQVQIGLQVGGFAEARASRSGPAFFDPDGKFGIGIACETGSIAMVENDCCHLIQAGTPLAPFQTISWKATLVPISGLDQPTAWDDHFALDVRGQEIRIQSSADRGVATLEVENVRGENFRASVNPKPDQLLLLNESSGLGEPRKLRISGDGFQFSWSADEDRASTPTPWRSSTNWLTEHRLPLDWFFSEPAPLRIYARDPILRSAAHLALAAHHASEQNWSEAVDSTDAAIEADAHLLEAWWFKAWLSDRIGEADAAADALANAHYLCPLHPLLRAHAFLAAPVQEGVDGNLVLRPLVEQHDSMIAVMNTLLWLRRWDLAYRFATECLRMVDLPMLNLLAAFALLNGSRMETEAAEMVRRAGLPALAPPYPWRPLDRIAINRLVERFPSDHRLRELKALLDAHPMP